MMNKVRKLLVLLLFLSAVGVQAAQRSMTEAQALAAQFTTKAVNVKMMRRAMGNNRLSIAYTEKSVVGDTSFVYVFNRGTSDGYVVVSGDDRTLPILGYTDKGTVSSDNMPENMKAWLGEYADQIRQVIRRNINTSAISTIANRYTTAVEPLLGDIAWAQDAPYNNLCPMQDGLRCPAGCVATAMAQIMRYHQWPEKGTGSHSYAWNDTILSSDFSRHTYDWAHMTPTYGENSTEVENSAVAQLMYDCGVSLDMQYAPSVSVAFSYAPVSSLVDYFGYNPTTVCINRIFYYPAEWDSIIKEELDAKRPVAYRGATNMDIGHEFVCDGYNEQGYFHFNWGWGGSADGYYLTSVLEMGYDLSMDQNAVIGIETPLENPHPAERKYHISMIGRPVLLSDSTLFSREATIPFNTVQTYYNFGLKEFIGDLGMGIYDAQGQLVKVLTVFEKDTLPCVDIKDREGLLSVSLVDMPVGTYEMWPIFRPDGGEWTKPLYAVAFLPVVTFDVTDAQIAVTVGRTPWKFVVSDMKTSPQYLNRKNIYSLTLKNLGEIYSGIIYLCVLDRKMKNRGYVDRKYAVMEHGESLLYTFYPDFTDEEPGDYYLALEDFSENIISLSAVTLKPEPSAPCLYVDQTEITEHSDSHFRFTAQISNRGGYSIGKLNAYLQKKEDEDRFSREGYQVFEDTAIDSAETQTIDVDFNISSLPDGEYKVRFFDFNAYRFIGGKDSVTCFTVGVPTGIRATESSATANDDAPYYTPQGVKMEKPAQKGIYIRRGKKIVKKQK